jgi:hypothetical protein
VHDGQGLPLIVDFSVFGDSTLSRASWVFCAAPGEIVRRFGREQQGALDPRHARGGKRDPSIHVSGVSKLKSADLAVHLV